jgi:hypothetical protein
MTNAQSRGKRGNGQQVYFPKQEEQPRAVRKRKKGTACAVPFLLNRWFGLIYAERLRQQLSLLILHRAQHHGIGQAEDYS